MVNGLPSKQRMWVQVPSPIINLMEKTTPSTLYFQKMKQFFLKGGKKSTIEKLFFYFLERRALLKKDNILELLDICILNSTPFVQLKSRRRGKRIKYKIGFMEKERGEKKSLGVLQQNIYSKENSEGFVLKFEKELESLASGKNSMVLKRDEIHRLAMENTPYAWTYSKKKKLK
jgi:ribosomal protein S7